MLGMYLPKVTYLCCLPTLLRSYIYVGNLNVITATEQPRHGLTRSLFKKSTIRYNFIEALPILAAPNPATTRSAINIADDSAAPQRTEPTETKIQCGSRQAVI